MSNNSRLFSGREIKKTKLYFCTSEIKERMRNDELALIVVYNLDADRAKRMGPEYVGDRPWILNVK